MNFELKNVVSVGDVQSVDENNSLQNLNVTIGVVDCPYADIKTERTIQYVFSNDLTVKQAKDGVQPFAVQWVATNYPNT